MRVGVGPSGLTPGGDALLEGVGAVFAAPLEEFGFAVEDVDGGVVGSVPLGRIVADALAVGGLVP